MLSILSRNPDNKTTTVALVIMAIGVLFWLGCKVYEVIINYKHEQQKNKAVPDELLYNSFVYTIYHVDTLSTVKAFVSEDECIEYFKKHYRVTDGYKWVGIDILSMCEDVCDERF